MVSSGAADAGQSVIANSAGVMQNKNKSAIKGVKTSRVPEVIPDMEERKGEISQEAIT